eukprot:COSAG03_NODE_2541_length_2661_cov_6.439500_5_plen_32_part_00
MWALGMPLGYVIVTVSFDNYWMNGLVGIRGK